MARVLKNYKTPDGIVHEALVLVLGKVELDNGSTVVMAPIPGSKDTTPKTRRNFSFKVMVQAFHSAEALNEGAKPILDAAVSVNGSSLDYFVFAGKKVADILPDADAKAMTVADVIDAAAWAAVLAKLPQIFKDAEVVALGKSVFTDPSVSPVVNWKTP